MSAAATPQCPHFGACGGCQLQDVAAAAQLQRKQQTLLDLLGGALPSPLPPLELHASEPYAYRNRIRLRLATVAEPATEPTQRFGYNRAGSTEFLPITTCSIAAPLLVQAAEALLAAAAADDDCALWVRAAAEVELFANDDLSRLQLTLFCAPRTRAPQGSFARAMAAVQQRLPQLAGAEAHAFDPRTGPTGRVLASFGAAGLLYRVAQDAHWITRGAFFQVNRFLLPKLVELVTCQAAAGEPRSGAVAWDLFAGVGLFSRVLAQHFTTVTAVEANPVAAGDLRTTLARLGAEQQREHRAVQATTLEFLRRAVLDRERPQLIVLDPPRAGAGLEACALLQRLAAPQVVYVSCDPETLARDLAALTAPHGPYRLAQLHLLDLFPQTTHMETVAVLQYTASIP